MSWIQHATANVKFPYIFPFAAGRVVELAIVEPQISLQEQSSLTPASGVYKGP